MIWIINDLNHKRFMKHWLVELNLEVVGDDYFGRKENLADDVDPFSFKSSINHLYVCHSSIVKSIENCVLSSQKSCGNWIESLILILQFHQSQQLFPLGLSKNINIEGSYFWPWPFFKDVYETVNTILLFTSATNSYSEQTDTLKRYSSCVRITPCRQQ